MTTTVQRRKGHALSPTSASGCDSASEQMFTDPISPSAGSPPSISSSSSPTRSRFSSRRKYNWKAAYCPVILGALILTCYWLCTGDGFIPHQTNNIRLPIPNVDIQVPSAAEWPLIHIVNTRFMQEQGPLTTLGMARLHQFWAFCFPTMVSQSTQNFFWIIKTDPAFTSNTVFQQLLETVRPYPNIYVVASNQNFLVSSEATGCWQDGAEGLDILRSKVYTGDIHKLHQAIALRNDRPVLETRLDADDGLHKLYLQFMQYVALTRFTGVKIPTLRDKSGDDEENSEEEQEDQITKARQPNWLYWCTRRHIEWHPSSDSARRGGNSSVGVLNPIQHSKLCITPGITVGYNVGVDVKEVPIKAHDVLYKSLENSTACYGADFEAESSETSQCLTLVDDLLISAIRSRTWTSAGMRNVAYPEGRIPRKLERKMWQLLEERFNISQTTVQKAQEFLIQNKAQIAYENLLGQCTSFHSCKEEAKEELQKYIAEATVGKGPDGTIKPIHRTEVKSGLRVPWRPQ